MSELKPCPFCGETVSLDYSELPNKKHWYITCDCCGMMYQAVVCQRKDTKTGWNTRPIEDKLRKRIAELEKDNDEFRQLIHDWIIILTPDDGYVPDSECVRQAMLVIDKEREE